ATATTRSFHGRLQRGVAREMARAYRGVNGCSRAVVAWPGMREPTNDTCPECGAPVPPGAGCQASFHELLALEWEIPGGPGMVPHFYLVAGYGLQHPEAMGYTQEAVDGLVTAVSDILEGRATIDDVRHRARQAVAQAGRVTR